MISIKNLCFSYNKSPFIHTASLSFKDGELVAIIGPNGSGKSTLLKLICGELTPKKGEIIIEKKDARHISRRALAKLLSYFPQGRETPDMTALELVALGRFSEHPFGLAASNKDLEIAREALGRVNAAQFENVSLKKLSYGERQRVYLAMQMAQNAQNCLVDEPTNFLDAAAKFAMMDTLACLRNEGKCVICVLHDISLAMRYADRIIIMQDGKIFADGTPRQLYENQKIDKAFGITLLKTEDGGKDSYVASPKNNF